MFSFTNAGCVLENPFKLDVEHQYDGAGNGLLWKKSNTEGSTEFLSYDEMGRPLSEKRTTGSAIVILDYAYDLPGRPSSKSVTKNNIPFKSLNYEFYRKR